MDQPNKVDAAFDSGLRKPFGEGGFDRLQKDAEPDSAPLSDAG